MYVVTYICRVYHDMCMCTYVRRWHADLCTYSYTYCCRNEITEIPVTMIISGKISTPNVPAENENDTIRIKFQLLNVKLHNMCTYIYVYICVHVYEYLSV